MIFITGDMHGHIGINKLMPDVFTEQINLTKNDYVIICGDFGLVWNNGENERNWLDWLSQRNFTTLFIDGNHENFNLLETFEVSQFMGGKAHYITDSIIHLLRGQIYNIDNKRLFTFGGAPSIDKQYRISGKSWWHQEIPNNNEKNEGLTNLSLHNNNVDFIITHTCPDSIFNKLISFSNIKRFDVDYSTEEYLEQVKATCSYSHWYFGHFHIDYKVDNNHTALFNTIVPLV